MNRRYRDAHMVRFFDAAGKELIAIKTYALTKKEAQKIAIDYGNPPAYHSITTEKLPVEA